ncbi:MAG TPA: S8 family serine peptidase, partial [Thermohalobaculum sp.]|nr:S8 family serine peptidase [Thermohalobaculum sp.]
MNMNGNGGNRDGNFASSGATRPLGLAEGWMPKLEAIFAAIILIASAFGLALLLAGPAAAASIETPPGAAPTPPPGAAVANQRADVNRDRIEDGLAARMAGRGNGERFDVIVIFEGPNAVGRGRAAAGPFTVTREFTVINGFQASLTAGQIRGLSRANGLFKISENATVSAFDIPSNDDMGVTAARADFGFDGSGVTICVIDTGVDASHEQFNTKGPGLTLLGPQEFHDAVNGQLEPYDDQGHGTHVSGISTGDGVGGTSLADDAIGVAPGASLVVAKVLDANGSGSDAQVIEGIEWCAGRNDVDILSMSLGGPGTDGTDPLSIAVNCVADSASSPTCSQSNTPKIVVVSAGNSGALWSTVGTPGVAENAITVGSAAEWTGDPSTNWQDDGLYLNSFSSRGPVVDSNGAAIRIKPDIVGPGSKVLSSYIGSTANAYAIASGTSMSAPFVSGVIALMLEADPTLVLANADGLPHVKVRNILASTAHDRGAPGIDNEYGHGVIDAYSAVAEADPLVTSYVPNAYPGAISLANQTVADFGNWTEEFTVTPDLVGLPIAGTATINGTFVEGCLFWFGSDCWIPENVWSPDLEVILEREVTPGSWSQVAAGSGEVTFSECPARGECGTIGRAEVVHFIPPSAGTFRFRVFPADDSSNLGVGGGFDFEISMGAPDSGSGGNSSPVASITSPANGAVFILGDQISFTGSAND